MRIESAIVATRDLGHAGIIGEGIVELVYSLDVNDVERTLLYVPVFYHDAL